MTARRRRQATSPRTWRNATVRAARLVSPCACSELTSRLHAMRHERVTGAVHDTGGAIALQVLHAGRYGYHPLSQSASDKKSPITPLWISACIIAYPSGWRKLT